jgi:hypothetical protein
MPAAGNHATDQTTLAPELEAVAAAAADRLSAETDSNTNGQHELEQPVARAATAAITAGLSLAAIADAERIGQARAREQLRPEALRRVERAARRRRDADAEYAQAITRAARLGLAHRDIATAADVAHGTIRAIIARAEAPANDNPPSHEPTTIDAPPHEPAQLAQ